MHMILDPGTGSVMQDIAKGHEKPFKIKLKVNYTLKNTTKKWLSNAYVQHFSLYNSSSSFAGPSLLERKNTKKVN